MNQNSNPPVPPPHGCGTFVPDSNLQSQPDGYGQQPPNTGAARPSNTDGCCPFIPESNLKPLARSDSAAGPRTDGNALTDY
ncbi:MAG TPA: hypothetical protein VGR14_13005 [Verrucomicrobiae bacterium]|nr:hypothetical protein [Verrucomicrobiae bacterium]